MPNFGNHNFGSHNFVVEGLGNTKIVIAYFPNRTCKANITPRSTMATFPNRTSKAVEP